MQKIEAIIFDIDGTLANTLPIIIEAMRQVVEPLVKHPLTDKEIEAGFGPNEEGSIRNLAPDADITKATADFLNTYQTLFDTMDSAPFAGIEALLQNLQSRGVKLAISTAKGKESTDFTLSRWGFTSYFEIVETGSPEASRKPEAIPRILAALGNLPAAAAMYVGDTTSDVKDSRQAGIAVATAAWAPTAKVDELQQERPNEIFYTVADFATWINNNL